MLQAQSNRGTWANVNAPIKNASYPDLNASVITAKHIYAELDTVHGTGSAELISAGYLAAPKRTALQAARTRRRTLLFR
jgi:hypothetical protein